MADLLLLVLVIFIVVGVFKALPALQERRYEKKRARLMRQKRILDEQLEQIVAQNGGNTRRSGSRPYAGGSSGSSGGYSAPRSTGTSRQSYTPSGTGGSSPSGPNDARRQEYLRYADQLEQEANSLDNQAYSMETQAARARGQADSCRLEASQADRLGDPIAAQRAYSSQQTYENEANAAQQEAYDLRVKANSRRAQAQQARWQAQNL